MSIWRTGELASIPAAARETASLAISLLLLGLLIVPG
jgi:hypothetical protein